MTSFPRRAALVLTAAVFGAACAGQASTAAAAGPATPPAARPPAAAPRPPSTPPRTGGHGHAAAVASATPAGWPVDVPLPPGTLLGSTGTAAQWSVLLLEPGAAPDVQRSTIAFYVAAGFVADPAQVLRRAPYAITVGAENRDHSATSTNLTIGLVRH